MADDKVVRSTPPSMVGKKHYLRPATVEDIKKSYHWVTLSEPQSYNITYQPILSAAEAADQYKAKTANESEATFMVVSREDDKPVGLARFDKLNSLNRSAEIFCLFDPDEKYEKHGQETVDLLLNYLFRFRNLNRVTVAISEEGSAVNSDMNDLCEKIGFKKEGTLRQHHFYDGEFHDVNLYSILAFEWGG